MNIFVAKLNFRTTSEELRSLFEQFGEVTSAKVIVDHETGRSKGFGFVEMAHDSEANDAINTLNETEFHERTIVVKKATPQEKRPQSNYNQGGGNFHRGGGNNRGYNNRY
jgi:RNA recognition motif-containing protein